MDSGNPPTNVARQATYHQTLGRDSIRTILLQPGQIHDEIVCSFNEQQLSQSPQYLALSYVWGSATDLSPIRLCDTQWSVTSNLASALRYLRDPKECLTLWVDALSINQENSQEKSHQVGMMDQIYKNASETLVFLGEGPDRVPLDPSPRLKRRKIERDEGLLHWVVKESASESPVPPGLSINNTVLDQRQPPYQHELDPITSFFHLLGGLAQNLHISDFKLLQDSGPQRDAMMDTISDVLSVPWWTRAWTVQEIVVPKQVTLVYGHVRISWKVLEDAMFSHVKHTSSCCKIFFKSLPDRERRLLSELWETCESIKNERLSYCKMADRNFLTLIRKFRPRKATNPRDKVYAFLSLIFPQSNRTLQVDYSLSMRDVFRDAAIHIIEQSRSLEILATELITAKATSLPSWVPDFSIIASPGRDHYTINLHDRLWPYSLHRLRTGEAEIARVLRPMKQEDTKDGTVLLQEFSLGGRHVCADNIGLRSHELGPVVDVGPLMCFDHGPDPHVLEECAATIFRHRPEHASFMDIFECFCGNNMSMKRSPEEANVWEATPMHMGARFTMPLGDIQAENFFHWLQSIVATSADFPNLRRIMDLPRPEDCRINLGWHMDIPGSVYLAMCGRRLFVTSDRIGLGPPDIRKGDVAYFLKGSRVLSVLRGQDLSKSERVNLPVHSSSGTQPPHFIEAASSLSRFVGDCYVQGAMNGGYDTSGWSWPYIFLE